MQQQHLASGSGAGASGGRPGGGGNSGINSSSSYPSGFGSAENCIDAAGIPDPPERFPELDSMSLKDLRSLHDERAKFDYFISRHKHQRLVDDFVSRVRTDVECFEREQQIAMSTNMDDVNEQSLLKLRTKIKEMESEVSGLQKLKDEWLEHNSPERLMERLRVAMRESEAVSDALEKSMLSSSMNFDDFLAEYIACRKKYHERSLKLEQLKVETKRKSYGR